MSDSTAFLFTGSSPIQTGVAPDAIDPSRAAVLRGTVVAPDGGPLSGVLITVKDHPELGQTLSRDDGMFDLGVNGGSWLTVEYRKGGFVPAQRQVKTEWATYAWAPEVKLVAYDTQVTTVDLAGSEPMQVAQGSIVTDADGARQATLLVPQGTSAVMEMPDGSTQPLTSLSIRATEYTVGPDGPKAMPMPLPPSSGYTYAVEYSVDEAVAAGAKDVRFSQPLHHYVENFLGFPIGMVVPVGYYDRDRVAWVPSDNGRVIQILNVIGGLAELDIDGSGLPADTTGLATLGVTDAERAQLATLYAPGTELWRVPITHFTPWDCNWPYGPPDDGEPPPDDGGGPPGDDGPPLDDRDGCETPQQCVIEVENQIWRETVPIVGTPFSLNYSSDRVLGRLGPVTIPLSGASVPASLKRIDLTVEVAGQQILRSHPPQPNLSTTFQWNGMDAYGRPAMGHVEAKITVGFVYDGVYTEPANFGQAFAQFSNIPISGNRARQEVTIERKTVAPLRVFDARGLGLGAWTLDRHHVYDRPGSMLYLGDGSRRSASSIIRNLLGTLAFTPFRTSGSDVPGLASDAAGNLVVAHYVLNQVFFVPHDALNQLLANRRCLNSATVDQACYEAWFEIINARLAGTESGSGGYSGDGGPATLAQLNRPAGVAVDADGNVFIADSGNHRIRRVDAATGIITSIAGTGVAGYSGDGGPAALAQLRDPRALAVDAAGNLLIVDRGNRVIRRVEAVTGVITTFAGSATTVIPWADGEPAPGGRIALLWGVAVDTIGNVYFTDGGRVGRVDAVTGIINTFAGGGTLVGTGADGAPATAASLITARGVAVDAAGNVFVTEANGHRIRRIDAGSGIINTLAGTGVAGASTDGAATAAKLTFPTEITTDPAGNLFFTAAGRHDWVWQVYPAFDHPFGDIVPDSAARELYLFDFAGRHAETRHALTGEVLLSFAYDSAGKLTEVRDGDGNVTTIERDTDGNPTGILAPFGQRTTLDLDPNGYLARVTNPAGETVQMTYTSSGLITRMEDARGNATVMTYDAKGRLLSDSDAAGGAQTLGLQSGTAGAYAVTRTTALGRTSSHLVEQLPTGDRRQTDTESDGTQTVRLIKTDGSRNTTLANGIVDTLVDGPDPRFSMLAPVEATHTTTTPNGRLLSTSQSRSVSLSDPLDPLSVTSTTETQTVNGRSFTTGFAASTRTFTSTSAAGRQSSTTIDGQGRAVSQGVAGLLPVDFAYDPSGRLATASRGSGAGMRYRTYAYNPAGFLDTITDALTRTIGFQYDLAGRLTTQTLPDGRQIQFGYDATGKITSITPPGRPAHTFEYTPVNLLSRYVPPDVGAGTNATVYTYNADRQITRIDRPDGKAIQFGYDAAGRLETTTIARGTYTNTYDPVTGNLTSITAPDGGTVSYTHDGNLLLTTTWSGAVNGSVTRTYDNDFRIASISVNGANPISYTYDADGLLVGAGALTLTRDPQNNLITGTMLGNITDTMSYNEFGEIVEYVARYSGADIYGYQLIRDQLGRITQKIETIEGVTDIYDYEYDLAGRLVQVAIDGSVASTYTYDSNGNRLTGPGATSPATYDDQDRLLQYRSATFAYTAAGELATKADSGEMTRYTYDELGNLLALSSSSADIEYLVDAANQRVGKRTSGSLDQAFLWENNLRPSVTLDAAGAIVSRFVYAEHVNVPEYMVRGGATYRFITDHLGSPRLLVEATTGTITQQLDFDEFGALQRDSNPGFQPFAFAGGLYDASLVRFRSRDYDAETGRWLSRDQILFDGGNTNLYTYAHGDPVNFIDVSGNAEAHTHFAEDATFDIIKWINRPNDGTIGGALQCIGRATVALPVVATTTVAADLEHWINLGIDILALYADILSDFGLEK